MAKHWILESAVILDQMSYRGLVGESHFTISDFAKWINSSKPTARKLAQELVNEGYLMAVYTGEYRGKPKYAYTLSDDTLLHSMANTDTWKAIEKQANAFYANRIVGP